MIRVCKQCNSEFQTENHYSKFCNRKCFAEFRSKRKEKVCPSCGLKFKQPKVGQIYCSRSCADKGLIVREQERVCKHCGKEYMFKGNNTTYCSQECYSASRVGVSRVDKVKKVCEQCGKEFEVLPCWSNRRFCSRSCVFASKVKTITKNCFHCGKEFSTIPSRKESKFCSNSCNYKALRASVQYDCNQCGKTFETVPSHLGAKFCSYTCYWDSKIENNQDYPREFNSTLKEFVRERDCRICQNCGKPEFENRDGNKLSVHHIDYDKENCEENNLISLCECCHIKTNHNREKWKLHFQTLIEVREILNGINGSLIFKE